MQTMNLADADKTLLSDALREVCRRIEACGASPELTNAVSLAGDLYFAVQQNDPYALARVKSSLQAR